MCSQENKPPKKKDDYTSPQLVYKTPELIEQGKIFAFFGSMSTGSS